MRACKRIAVLALMALGAGCGPSAAEVRHARYPALDESPPPPPPPAPEELAAPPQPEAPKAIVLEDSWSQRQREKEELVDGLRKYAAEADKDDPFALSEEQIQELAAREGVLIN